MKKMMLTCMVFMLAAVMAAPAMASDMKMTMTGHMEVDGYLIKGTVAESAYSGSAVSNPGDSTDAWYQQELVMEPIFHINDQIRIHNKVTILERDWGGTQGGAVAYSPGTLDAGTGESFLSIPSTGTGVSIGGDQSRAHNFWWEQCYLSFPLYGGHLYVGRMPGGKWAYDFTDDDDNRDRIKYVKQVGHNVLVFVVEKLEELDGGSPSPNGTTTRNNAANQFTSSDSDTDAYALGGVIPFSKDIIWKPLLYFVDYGGNSVTGTAAGSLFPNGAERYYIFNGLMFRQEAFKLDAEVIYIWDDRGTAPGAAEVEGKQLLYWLDAGITEGPNEFAIGHYYVQGDDGVDNTRNSLYGTGNMFEPLLLMHSRDIGLYNDSMGVPNGQASVALGSSGFVGYYLRSSHKISEDKKISAILGWLQADEMLAGTATGGGTADKDLGKEVDITFDWNFMPNITYTAAFAYFMTGDYYDDTDGNASQDLTNDPYAVLQKLTIDW